MATNTSPLGYSYVGGNGGMSEDQWNQLQQYSQSQTPGMVRSYEGTDFSPNWSPEFTYVGGSRWQGTYSQSSDPSNPPTLTGYMRDAGGGTWEDYDTSGTRTGSHYADNSWSDFIKAASLPAMAYGAHLAGVTGGMGMGAAEAAGAGATVGGSMGAGAQGLVGTELGTLASSASGTFVPGVVDLSAAGMTSSGAIVGGGGSGWSGLGSLFKDGLSLKQGLGGTASLYDIWSRNQMANAQQSQMENSQNQINNLYAPGSPEYNLLAEKIARSNAASGRNSQVGQFASTLAGTIAEAKLRANQGAMNQQNSLLNSSLQNRYGGIGSLFFNIANLAGK